MVSFSASSFTVQKSVIWILAGRLRGSAIFSFFGG
jgi:hypothetical protein